MTSDLPVYKDAETALSYVEDCVDELEEDYHYRPWLELEDPFWKARFSDKSTKASWRQFVKAVIGHYR